MRALVIEDDVASLELLQLRLENLGYDVTMAQTAEEGIRSAAESHPQVIFTDLKLDGDLTQGVSIINTLRQDPATCDIPIVIHSVFVAHPADMPEALPMADGYLLKPFKFDDLRRVLSDLSLPSTRV